MSLETVRDWHRKEHDENASIAKEQHRLSAAHAMYQSMADHHGAMADAIDAHLSRDAVVSDEDVTNARSEYFSHGGSASPDFAWKKALQSFAARHAAVPDLSSIEKMSYPDDVHSPRYIMDHNFALGWNACREAMLAQRDGGKPEGRQLVRVAKIKDVDEYGPMIDWFTHWVELKGKELFTND
jgi:hypothetical protein